MHLIGEGVSEIQFRFIFPALLKCNFDFILEGGGGGGIFIFLSSI